MTGAVDWIWRVPADQAESLKAHAQHDRAQRRDHARRLLCINNNGTTPESAPFKDAARAPGDQPRDQPQGAWPTAWCAAAARRCTPPASAPSSAATRRKVATYDYNPAKAKALLAEAGYPNGFDTDLWAYRERDYAEAIIGDLRKVGIRARLHFVQYPALRTELRSGRAPLTFQAWGSFGVNDASAFAGNFFKGGPDDTAKDPQVIALLQHGRRHGRQGRAQGPSTRRRCSASRRRPMWAPLFSYSTNYAFTSDLKFEAQPTSCRASSRRAGSSTAPRRAARESSPC